MKHYLDPNALRLLLKHLSHLQRDEIAHEVAEFELIQTHVKRLPRVLVRH